MATVDVHEAETHLSRLVESLVSGAEREVVIARDGSPAVRMTAVAPARVPRQFGFAKGRFELSNDFDELDAEIARLFEDSADPYGEKLDRLGCWSTRTSRSGGRSAIRNCPWRGET